MCCQRCTTHVVQTVSVNLSCSFPYIFRGPKAISTQDTIMSTVRKGSWIFKFAKYLFHSNYLMFNQYLDLHVIGILKLTHGITLTVFQKLICDIFIHPLYTLHLKEIQKDHIINKKMFLQILGYRLQRHICENLTPK